jgi:UPF0716 protein FxsA
MFTRLLAAFILVPLIELMLLIQLAKYTSLTTTIMLVIVTGIIGSWLARREGVMTWFRFQSALAEGRPPSHEIQDGLMIVFAAALLLTPGLLTDALGFTLLLPQGRELIRRTLLKRYMQRFQVQFHQPSDFVQEPLNRTQRDSSFTIDADSFQRKTE